MSAEAISLNEESLPKVRLHATAVFVILNHFVRRSDKDARVLGKWWLLGIPGGVVVRCEWTTNFTPPLFTFCTFILSFVCLFRAPAIHLSPSTLSLLDQTGTLLGRKDGNVIEVTDCFGVPFIEKTNDLYVAINKEYHNSMYAATRRVSRKEEIVGWFSTTKDGALIVDNSSLVNDFYSQECNGPIHLVVDANMTGMNLNVRGFVSTPICLGDTAFANMFEEVEVEVVINEAETKALYHMIYNTQEGEALTTEMVSSLPSEGESVEMAVEKLLSSIDELQVYVDEVVAGKREGSPQVGLALFDALSSLQAYKQEDLSARLRNKVQDLLMVAYLSSIMKTQLKISDKIHAIV